MNLFVMEPARYAQLCADYALHITNDCFLCFVAVQEGTRSQMGMAGCKSPVARTKKKVEEFLQ